MALEHTRTLRPLSSEKTEKEKMLEGESYRPYDPTLADERERCKKALWQFNNAANPIYGIAMKEQWRFLKEIVQPSTPISGSPSSTTSTGLQGSIGIGAIVEAPFHCQYGYNLNIGEEVMISEGCIFIDSCTITIGAHTTISTLR